MLTKQEFREFYNFVRFARQNFNLSIPGILNETRSVFLLVFLKLELQFVLGVY